MKIQIDMLVKYVGEDMGLKGRTGLVTAIAERGNESQLTVMMAETLIVVAPGRFWEPATPPDVSSADGAPRIAQF